MFRYRYSDFCIKLVSRNLDIILNLSYKCHKSTPKSVISQIFLNSWQACSSSENVLFYDFAFVLTNIFGLIIRVPTPFAPKNSGLFPDFFPDFFTIFQTDFFSILTFLCLPAYHITWIYLNERIKPEKHSHISTNIELKT